MSIRILENCTIFDGVNEELIEGGSVLIENDRIREVSDTKVSHHDAEVTDLGGRFLMPGLLDIHFHAYSISFNMSLLDNMTMPLKVAHAAQDFSSLCIVFWKFFWRKACFLRTPPLQTSRRS